MARHTHEKRYRGRNAAASKRNNRQSRVTTSSRNGSGKQRLCSIIEGTGFLMILVVTVMRQPYFFQQGYYTKRIQTLLNDNYMYYENLLSNQPQTQPPTSAAAPCIMNATLQTAPRDHPHAGARDACGNFGYRHDPTALIHQQSALARGATFDNRTCLTPFGQGTEEAGGYEGLQRIKISDTTSVSSGDSSSSSSRSHNATNRPLRLLCMIYSVDTEDNEELARAVLETWGHKCDGFMVASNVTKPSIGAVDLPHLGEEAYGSMWQKVRSMWAYVYDNYLDDFDFVYVCGDDTYVVVENLRQILQEAHTGTLFKDPKWKQTSQIEYWEKNYPPGEQRPLYLGAVYPMRMNRYACAGGAGYVLNRLAIQKMVEVFPNHTHANFIDSREDFFVADTLRDLGIVCSDTRDSTGAWRFHHLDAQAQYNYKSLDEKKATWIPDLLLKTHGISSRLSVEGVSERTVSFHLTKTRISKASPERLRRYHAILYGLCKDS